MKSAFGVLACILIAFGIIAASESSKYDHFKLEVTNASNQVTLREEVPVSMISIPPMVSFINSKLVFNKSGRAYEILDGVKICVTADTVFDANTGKTIHRIQQGQKACFNKQGYVD